MKSNDSMAPVTVQQPLGKLATVRLCRRGHLVNALGQTGNLSGGVTFMDGALTGGSGNDGSRFLQRLFGIIHRAANHSFIELVDSCFHFRPVHFVAQTGGLCLTVSLFCGFMICHVLPPVIFVSLPVDEFYVFEFKTAQIPSRAYCIQRWRGFIEPESIHLMKRVIYNASKSPCQQ